jgi:hypothetical protein
MNAFLASLQVSPTGAIALLSATISATVAILVVIITQWVVGRRARTDLLTKKLEELFLLVNEASIENGKRRNAGLDLIKTYAKRNAERKDVMHLSRNLPLDHKINMYVQLYFPLLRETHAQVATINQEMVDVFHKLSDGDKTRPDEVARAFLRMYLALTAFRDEIVENRALLVCETLRRPAYRKKEYSSLKPTNTGKPVSAA